MTGRALYPEVDLSDWDVYDLEQIGSKPEKLWMVPPDDPDGRWLWKPRTEQRHRDETFWKGDDWAERAAGGASCLDALQEVQVSDIEDVVDAVPPDGFSRRDGRSNSSSSLLRSDRMSLPARTFVVRLLTENLTR